MLLCPAKAGEKGHICFGMWTIRKNRVLLDVPCAGEQVSDFVPALLEGVMQQIDFRFFGLRIRIFSAVPGIIRHLQGMFPEGDYSCSDDGVDEIYHLFSLKSSEGGRVYVVAKGHEARFFTREKKRLVSHMGAVIKHAVAKNTEGFATFHAGAGSLKGVGVMLPAESGKGKSTLMLSLLVAGFQYLSDEITLLNQSSLELVPFNNSLAIRSGVFTLFPQFRKNFSNRFDAASGKVEELEAFLPPRAVREDCLSRPCPLGLVVFPAFSPGRRPRMAPLARGRAALKLLEHCFSLGRSPEKGMETIVSALRGVDCYTLTYHDVDKAADMIRRALPA